MGVTRKLLYEEVWAEPMITVAARYDVSSSYLARVCKTLNVPRPERGYWAKLKVGKAPAQPPLPEPEPGDALEWTPGQIPKASERLLPKPPKKTRRIKRPNLTTSGKHPLCAGIEQHYEKVRPSEVGYLRPYKTALVDMLVSKDVLDRAIQFSNKLFIEFESYGHRTMLAPTNEHFSRPILYPSESGTTPNYFHQEWTPHRPTVVFIGSVAFGITIYELSEEIEVKYKNGKYLPVEAKSKSSRNRYHHGYDWTTTREFPTGRLAVRASSPYDRIEWERTWKENEPGDLEKQFATIRRALQREAKSLAEEVAKVRKQQEEEHRRWLEQQEKWRLEREEQRRIWELEQKEKRRQEAYKQSRDQILTIVDQWSLACRLDSFFELVETETKEIDEEERDEFLARLNAAREMFGSLKALSRFKEWKTPEELF